MQGGGIPCATLSRIDESQVLVTRKREAACRRDTVFIFGKRSLAHRVLIFSGPDLTLQSALKEACYQTRFGEYGINSFCCITTESSFVYIDQRREQVRRARASEHIHGIKSFNLSEAAVKTRPSRVTEVSDCYRIPSTTTCTYHTYSCVCVPRYRPHPARPRCYSHLFPTLSYAFKFLCTLIPWH